MSPKKIHWRSSEYYYALSVTFIIYMELFDNMYYDLAKIKQDPTLCPPEMWPSVCVIPKPSAQPSLY